MELAQQAIVFAVLHLREMVEPVVGYVCPELEDRVHNQSDNVDEGIRQRAGLNDVLIFVLFQLSV